MKIVSLLGKGLRGLLVAFLIMAGLLCFRLAEPLYGIALVLLGLSLLPLFGRVVLSKLPVRNSPFLRHGFSFLLLVLIVTGLSLQGRATYDQKEPLGASSLDSLSIHPVKKQMVNGLDYYYIEAGTGEPLILCHGFPDMANTWDETITELSKNYRVIAPFLRGYYPTGIPEDGDYAVKTIASDVVELANQLGIDTFNIGGQDWGASISYAVANLAPQRVKRVAAIAIAHPSCLKLSPKLLWFGRHFVLFNLGDYGVRYTRKQDFRYIDRLYRRWSPDYENYQQSSNAIKETFKYPGRLEAAIGYYWSFNKERGDKERAAFYAQIPQAPVLFIGGENDGGVTPESVALMKEKMPAGSKVVVFQHSGHFLHHEIPGPFLTEMKAFLAMPPGSEK